MDYGKLKLVAFILFLAAFACSSAFGADEADKSMFYHPLFEQEVVAGTNKNIFNELNTGNRDDFTGRVGFTFRTECGFDIDALGRAVNPDSNGGVLQADHIIELWDVATAKLLASVTVNNKSSKEGGYVFEKLQKPVTLVAEKEYMQLSDEKKGTGDLWTGAVPMHNYDTDCICILGSEYGSPAGEAMPGPGRHGGIGMVQGGPPTFSIVRSSIKEVPGKKQILKVDANTKDLKILEGHFKGGTNRNRQGNTYSVNSRYFMRDGKPCVPVMGEMHYSRYPHQDWEESVLAMKAGGLDIISTYVFWVFHEEIQGKYKWTGENNLRKFLEICKKYDMSVWLRIGPWCHGDARNGGFPDWIYKVCKPRTMDPAYFAHVKRWYTAVSKQSEGMYFKDGGPVIGIQFDNEFGHFGGEGGDAYIIKCKEIARGLGMDVPYYSVCGWRGAWVPKDEVLPIQYSYVDPYWHGGTATPWPPKELLFSDTYSKALNAEPGSDTIAGIMKKEGMRYDPSRYPYVQGELGIGMLASHDRRPVLGPKDNYAHVLCRLGEGANLTGYYMYHGGSHPIGQQGYRLGEGGFLPYVYCNYGPGGIGEFGKTNETYHHIKRLHYFMSDFGDTLAPMTPALPDNLPDQKDPTKLRYALRSDGQKGFMFFNNYQRYLQLPARKNMQFSVKLADGELVFPSEPITIGADVSGVWPFNLTIADATLVYATAEPLLKWNDRKMSRLVLHQTEGVETELRLEGVKQVRNKKGKVLKEGKCFVVTAEVGDVVEITTSGGHRAEILVISEEESLNAWRAEINDKRHLLISPAEVFQYENNFTLRSRKYGQIPMRIYPRTKEAVYTANGKKVKPSNDGVFSLYRISTGQRPEIEVTAKPWSEVPEIEGFHFPHDTKPSKAWKIQLGAIDWEEVSDVVLQLDYLGDMAQVYLNGLLVADDFWKQPRWEIGLKRWKKELSDPKSELLFVASPWKKDLEIFVQKRPEITEDVVTRLDAKAFAEQKIYLKIGEN